MFEDCQHCKLSHAGVGGNVSAAHRRAGCMSRPTRIPDRGDIPPNAIASLMGLSLAEFQQLLPELNRRGFPPPDATTGRYCIEAVDRWRRRRYPQLFPELTASPTAMLALSSMNG
jgi:hypothetical protein